MTRWQRLGFSPQNLWYCERHQRCKGQENRPAVNSSGRSGSGEGRRVPLPVVPAVYHLAGLFRSTHRDVALQQENPAGVVSI
jgi:hypothetical protein